MTDTPVNGSPTEDQPKPEGALRPATLAEVKQIFGAMLEKRITQPDGQRVYDLADLYSTTELNYVRTTALSILLVEKGVCTQEELDRVLGIALTRRIGEIQLELAGRPRVIAAAGKIPDRRQQ